MAPRTGTGYHHEGPSVEPRLSQTPLVLASGDNTPFRMTEVTLHTATSNISHSGHPTWGDIPRLLADAVGVGINSSGSGYGVELGA
jgi:hypothetical protein